MIQIMAVVNLTPDSFLPSSRVSAEQARERICHLREAGADIIDLGAVSTRPGAAPVSISEEWARLHPVLSDWDPAIPLSVDTTRAEIVRRVYDCVGPFVVNDISAGEDDPEMLPLAGRLGLPYVAMHKRGDPRTMDSLCDYPGGVVPALVAYFSGFARKAETCGITDWVLDPGLGFAKTAEQNWEILEKLDRLRMFDRPILVGAADKRFTAGDTERAHRLALEHGADILRVHDVAASMATLKELGLV